MTISENALTVLKKRYLLPDETPHMMFMRVASTLAEVERRYGADDASIERTARQFYELMSELDFLPNSPTLANAGCRTGQLSACFVLPLEDDLGAIFDTVRAQALIHQTGGGTGFSGSRLRPKGDRVGSTHGVSSGPLSFLEVLNAATESIKQGGMRRGANMGILRVDHPDILDFISYKKDKAKLTNFNVSVAATNAFMAAVSAGSTYALINPRTGEEVGRLNAREVLEAIIEGAWESGEPGLVFLDRMNEYCPVPWMGLYEATNPCGEQPLIPYESCNLGSINLERFVLEDYEGPFKRGRIDWERLQEAVAVSTHLLDNVIDANTFPIPELERVALATRKIGLGVMGFARMLFKLGIGYHTPEASRVAAMVMSFIDYHSKLTSVGLAVAKGAFPARAGHEPESNAIYKTWCMERQDADDRHPDCDYLALADLIETYGIRNSTTTTIAPTGTIGIIADTSGGCEPAFALAFKRWQADTHMLDTDRVFLAALNDAGIVGEDAALVLAAVDRHHGSLREALATGGAFNELLAAPLGGMAKLEALSMLSSVYVVAHDVSPAEHVAIQAAFQRFNDSATSKTINFPAHATIADVAHAYRLAWVQGCKGITVYRDGSRDEQPLSTSSAAAPAAPTKSEPSPVEPRLNPVDPAPRPRPEDLYGFTRTLETAEGRLYVGVNYDDQGIREVFANLGRSGGVLFSLTEAIGRLISLALQYRVPVEELAKQLIGIRGGAPTGMGPRAILSIPDAIGRVIAGAPRTLMPSAEDWKTGSVPAPGGVHPAMPGELEPELASTRRAVERLGHSPECRECGAPLNHAEGCATCPSCGWSRCS